MSLRRSASTGRAGPIGLLVLVIVVTAGLTAIALTVRGGGRDATPAPGRIPTPGPVCDVSPEDGHAAVSAAIAACPDGSTVLFPRGATYTQTAPIRVERRSNLTIDGNGSSFVSTAPNNDQLNPNWMVVDGSDVELRDMQVEGNFKMGPPRSLQRMQQVLPSGNHFNAGIAIYGGNRVTVRDVAIRDTFGDGALVAPSGILPGGAGATAGVPQDVRLQRLSITRTARQGVAITGGKGIRLEDSRITDSWYLGVDIEIDVPGQPLQDVQILRNTFDGTFFGAIALPWPGDGRSIDGIQIRGNRTLRPPDSCGPQISINATPGQTLPVANVVTEQNHLLTLSRGIVYGNVRSGVVRDNYVEKRIGTKPCGDPAEAPVIVAEAGDVVVDGNTSVNY